MGFESLFTQTFYVIDEEIELEESSIMAKKKSKSMLACPFKACEAVFTRPYRLEDHINMHTGELPFKCKIPGCNKKYRSRNSLRVHVRMFHESKDLLYTTFLRCPYPNCLMVLRNRDTLHKHYQRQHTGQSKFMCQYCDKGFHKHTQLQSHVYHHTGIPPFRCAACDAGFVHQRDLNRHLRGHRKWECDVEGCYEVFDSWNVLRKHLGTDHSGEFVCDGCQKTFKTKHALRMHVLCHLEDSSRSVLHCPYEDCERVYFQKRNLDHHIRYKHKGKTHDCKECGRKLSTKAKLTEHEKRLHKQPVQAKKQTTPRKKRKDAGIPHQSMAAKLSGATIPHEEEKLLLKNEYKTAIEVDPHAETSLTTYSTCQAAKRRTVAKRKSSENPWCVGCDSECKTISKIGSQKLEAPEATAVSVIETPEGSLKMQEHSPKSLALKCDIDDLHTEARDNSLPCDKLDANSERLKQKYTDYDDVKDISASASTGNVQSTIMSGLDYEHAHDEVQKISDIESGKKALECNVDPSVLEQTCLLNGKNNPTPKNENNESYDSDVLCKIQKKALDKNVVMDALHDQQLKKDWRQVYDPKKWLLVMTGMMELVCPKVSSEYLFTAPISP